MAQRPTSPTPDDELQALLRRVRHVELRARRAVNAAGQGAYQSRFKGRGMAFAETRAYAPGDDPRHVDWLATARKSDAAIEANGTAVDLPLELYVKQFVEERELTLLLAVDLSGSMGTGSRARTKRQIAAEAAALLAFSALRNNDKVGLVLFTDRIELLVRPQKGRGHVLRIVREVLGYKPQSTRTRMAPALETTARLSNKRAIVALISDFVSGELSSANTATGARPSVGAERALQILARRHDLLAIAVEDPLDSILPDVGLVAVRDPETGDELLLDTSDARVRAAYTARAQHEKQQLAALFARTGVDSIRVTAEQTEGPLVSFLKSRARRAA